MNYPKILNQPPDNKDGEWIVQNKLDGSCIGLSFSPDAPPFVTTRGMQLRAPADFKGIRMILAQPRFLELAERVHEHQRKTGCRLVIYCELYGETQRRINYGLAGQSRLGVFDIACGKYGERCEIVSQKKFAELCSQLGIEDLCVWSTGLMSFAAAQSQGLALAAASCARPGFRNGGLPMIEGVVLKPWDGGPNAYMKLKSPEYVAIENARSRPVASKEVRSELVDQLIGLCTSHRVEDTFGKQIFNAPQHLANLVLDDALQDLDEPCSLTPREQRAVKQHILQLISELELFGGKPAAPVEDTNTCKNATN